MGQRDMQGAWVEAICEEPSQRDSLEDTSWDMELLSMSDEPSWSTFTWDDKCPNCRWTVWGTLEQSGWSLVLFQVRFLRCRRSVQGSWRPAARIPTIWQQQKLTLPTTRESDSVCTESCEAFQGQRVLSNGTTLYWRASWCLMPLDQGLPSKPEWWMILEGTTEFVCWWQGIVEVCMVASLLTLISRIFD